MVKKTHKTDPVRDIPACAVIIAGHIRRTESGWRYQPKGSKKMGEPNNSLEAIKRSLET